MFGPKRILAIDIGASKVVLAEFAVGRGALPELTRYGVGQLEIDPESDTHSSAILVSALRELMREHGIKPAPLYLSISGQAVFPRYVKLPPVTKDKLYQIVRYEAEQNVPFPINEVVWDYQLLPGQTAADTNVMLVAVKTENVTRLTDCVQAAHLEPLVVDAAPMALYNAVCQTQSDLSGCTLILDMGARSSNLIFVEEHRIFSRSVPVAGNAITQEIAKAFDVSFEEAEDVKKTHGQVDLGGTYEASEDEGAQQIAKIARNVMTRLHAEVNRSVNFYRSQQGGSSPSRVLLTGGASIMPYTDTFFSEKLKVPVEYLNPFTKIGVAPSIKTERIDGEIHLLGEVVGLALRHATRCPIELNLMPPDLVAIKTFRRRQPFFAVAAVAVVLLLLAFWGYSKRMQAARRQQLGKINDRIASLEAVQGQLTQATQAKAAVLEKVDDITDVIDRRTAWLEVLEGIHACMLDGMWLTSVRPMPEADGSIPSLLVSGKGFDDRLKQFDSANVTAIELFRDRLRNSSLFKEGTDIKALPPPGPGDYHRDFTIRIELERPFLNR